MLPHRESRVVNRDSENLSDVTIQRFNESRMRSIGRRLTPRVNQLIICGHAVKTLESKETRASKEITVTHSSVFAAHRLLCRMTNRKKRHPAFCLYRNRIRLQRMRSNGQAFKARTQEIPQVDRVEDVSLRQSSLMPSYCLDR